MGFSSFWSFFLAEKNFEVFNHFRCPLIFFIFFIYQILCYIFMIMQSQAARHKKYITEKQSQTAQDSGPGPRCHNPESSNPHERDWPPIRNQNDTYRVFAGNCAILQHSSSKSFGFFKKLF